MYKKAHKVFSVTDIIVSNDKSINNADNYNGFQIGSRCNYFFHNNLT